MTNNSCIESGANVVELVIPWWQMLAYIAYTSITTPRRTKYFLGLLKKAVI